MTDIKPNIKEEELLFEEYQKLKTFFAESEHHKTILAHIGNITQDTVVTITYFIESQMELQGETRKRIKKIVNASIEILQNILYHAERNEGGFHLAYFFIGKDLKKDEYQIYSSNFVRNDDLGTLNNRIDFIEESDIEKINEKFLEIEENAEFNDKQGGGLGLLTIALVCNKNVEFTLKKVNKNYSLFSVKAIV